MSTRSARSAVVALLLAWVTALLVASCLQVSVEVNSPGGDDTESPPATPSPDPTPTAPVLSALWFATDQGIYRLVPGDGEVALLAAGAVVDAIDIDVRRNRLFLHHPDALHQYALDGSLEAIEERTLPNTPVAHWLLEPAT
ncbi:MAG: hypothetical protein PHQ14_14010, partial [Chromatiales bacterium]|nr:hypothetical protein [Chromatiales bacterium]